MKIEILRKIPFKELEESVRKVPLMKKDSRGREIFVYKDATISLRTFTYDEVNPPTFYLINKNLETQRNLFLSLDKDHKITPLELDGALEIRNEKGEIWTLTPPIIEVTERSVRYVPQDGEIDYSEYVNKIKIPLICDGAHRVQVAREYGMPFIGLSIVGADPKHPYYAHPNGWDMVKIVDEVPKTKIEKKFYRYEDCYALYRDFDVLGCGKPRGVGK